jgi:membrane-bound lytic murein transglycosylase A
MQPGIPKKLAGPLLVAAALVLGAAPAMSGGPTAQRLSFAEVGGWSADRHDEALDTFLRSCAARGAGDGVKTLCPAARQAAAKGRDGARAFFEANFTPYRITSGEGRRGFVTGYFEPEVEGALRASREFSAPLYRLPPGRSAGSTSPFATRAEIESGALAGQGLELAFVRDRVEAFFIHVQGSARIRLAEGGVLRVAFAGKNGQPYTSIGKVLIDRGEVARKDMSAQRLRRWLEDNPGRADEVMAQNRSFIFFRKLADQDPALGPRGAQGVALAAGRSLAVDRKFHAFGTPVWLDGVLPRADGSPENVRRLMIAQDTGSAIVGPARGDIFFGSGDAAGARAGLTQHTVDFIVLWPNGAALPAWAR